MKVYIKPSIAHGEIIAPPSKSVSHRALICAALSGGSTVRNTALSDDIKATIGGLSSLGANVRICNDTVNLGGIDICKTTNAKIDAFESGSTLRFLIPVAMLGGGETTFSGTDRLFCRDLSVYEKITKEQNIRFIKGQNSLVVGSGLKSGRFKVRGDVSSQFISGLMFALPLLEGDSFIEITTPLESAPYVYMTVKMLSFFGVVVEERESGYFIRGGQAYQNREIAVEGDYSNAAFLDAFNLLGGFVKVSGLMSDTTQGDSIYKEYFKTIKAGGVFDISDCPDLAPVLFVLASVFSGAVFTGTHRLKIKESDRAVALKEEIGKFGGEMIIGENEVVVKKKKLHAPRIAIDSHNDHRIVMAMSLLASRYGGEISGAQAVNKSYPEFFNDIMKLGIEVDINGN